MWYSTNSANIFKVLEYISSTFFVFRQKNALDKLGNARYNYKCI